MIKNIRRHCAATALGTENTRELTNKESSFLPLSFITISFITKYDEGFYDILMVLCALVIKKSSQTVFNRLIQIYKTETFEYYIICCFKEILSSYM